MGIYLNPGAKLYEQALRSDIYIDKTGMIEYLNSVVNTQQKYLCVSRPRRFGKTTDIDMLCAYYDRTVDGNRIFAGLKISENNDRLLYRNQFDVIRINVVNFMKRGKSAKEGLQKLQKLLIRDLLKEYPEVDFFDKEDLQQMMLDIYSETQRGFVVALDEWDCMFRIYPDDTEGQKLYLDFLRDWIKDQEYIALVYMTGILPVKKYGEHSALNMFREFSMTMPM